MPSDLSIRAAAAVTGASENPAESRATLFNPPTHGPPTRAATPMPNPQLRLDAALGLVVIEFRDDSGAITTSIPSQRQLEAYRMWEQRRTDAPETKHQTQVIPGEKSAPPTTQARHSTRAHKA